MQFLIRAALDLSKQEFKRASLESLGSSNSSSLIPTRGRHSNQLFESFSFQRFCGRLLEMTRLVLIEGILCRSTSRTGSLPLRQSYKFKIFLRKCKLDPRAQMPLVGSSEFKLLSTFLNWFQNLQGCILRSMAERYTVSPCRLPKGVFGSLELGCKSQRSRMVQRMFQPNLQQDSRLQNSQESLLGREQRVIGGLQTGRGAHSLALGLKVFRYLDMLQLHSMVQHLGFLVFLKKATRADPSFENLSALSFMYIFCSVKLLPSYQKSLLFKDSSFGNRQMSSCVCSSDEQFPYMKNPFLAACACKSRQMWSRPWECKWRTSFLAAQTGECQEGEGLMQYRLRLNPFTSVRQWPLKTPSGLRIGIKQKTKCSRSSLARSSQEQRKFSTPVITCELGTSPGWTRAVMRTDLFWKAEGRSPLGKRSLSKSSDLAVILL